LAVRLITGHLRKAACAHALVDDANRAFEEIGDPIIYPLLCQFELTPSGHEPVSRVNADAAKPLALQPGRNRFSVCGQL